MSALRQHVSSDFGDVDGRVVRAMPGTLPAGRHHAFQGRGARLRRTVTDLAILTGCPGEDRNAFLTGTMKKLQTEYLKITFDDLPSEPMLPGDRKIN